MIQIFMQMDIMFFFKFWALKKASQGTKNAIFESKMHFWLGAKLLR